MRLLKPLFTKPILVGLSAILALVFVARAEKDVLIYNHSPSIPMGLYLRIDAPIERGAIATVRALDVAPSMARSRHFDGAKDRFIKRIAATKGDEVCGLGGVITVNGQVAAYRQQQDSAGRSLPSWTGCRVLGGEDLLLLGDTADSFDGRYWGVITRDQIEGVWRPLHF